MGIARSPLVLGRLILMGYAAVDYPNKYRLCVEILLTVRCRPPHSGSPLNLIPSFPVSPLPSSSVMIVYLIHIILAAYCSFSINFPLRLSLSWPAFPCHRIAIRKVTNTSALKLMIRLTTSGTSSCFNRATSFVRNQESLHVSSSHSFTALGEFDVTVACPCNRGGAFPSNHLLTMSPPNPHVPNKPSTNHLILPKMLLHRS
jgi:hypothetical protein